MLTMTAAESSAFSSHFTRQRLHINPDVSSLIMKSNDQWDVRNCCIGVYDGDFSTPKSEEDMVDLLEGIEMIGLDYDVDIKSDCLWKIAENESSKRASRHLSGGGLMEKPLLRVSMHPIKTVSNCSGSVVSTPQEQSTKTSSDDDIKISKNPFLNHLRLELNENTDPQMDLSKEGCAFSATNPFSNFNNSSLSLDDECVTPKLKRSPSQCSTRPVSPSLDVFNQLPNALSLKEEKEPRSKIRHVKRTASQCSPRRALSASNPFKSVPRPNSFIFALPAPALVDQSTQTFREPQWLFNYRKGLQTNLSALRRSGWYYENVSWQDSIILLQDSEPGTFLVRDSADPNFLFSLSIQTSRGPTSVRLHYIDGKFRLDAEEKLIPQMPSFDSVIELIEFYIAHCERKRHKSKRKKSIPLSQKEQVWIDSQGQVFSNILLTKPLRKHDKVNSLQHLSRLAVCGKLRNCFRSNSKMKSLMSNPSVPISNLIDSLCIPNNLSTYLKDYPHSQ